MGCNPENHSVESAQFSGENNTMSCVPDPGCGIMVLFLQLDFSPFGVGYQRLNSGTLDH